jgi:hypothetical protein
MFINCANEKGSHVFGHRYAIPASGSATTALVLGQQQEPELEESEELQDK